MLRVYNKNRHTSYFFEVCLWYVRRGYGCHAVDIYSYASLTFEVSDASRHSSKFALSDAHKVAAFKKMYLSGRYEGVFIVHTAYYLECIYLALGHNERFSFDVRSFVKVPIIEAKKG